MVFTAPKQALWFRLGLHTSLFYSAFSSFASVPVFCLLWTTYELRIMDHSTAQYLDFVFAGVHHTFHSIFDGLFANDSRFTLHPMFFDTPFWNISRLHMRGSFASRADNAAVGFFELSRCLWVPPRDVFELYILSQQLANLPLNCSSLNFT